jgi:hypothetical protein
MAHELCRVVVYNANAPGTWAQKVRRIRCSWMLWGTLQMRGCLELGSRARKEEAQKTAKGREGLRAG